MSYWVKLVRKNSLLSRALLLYYAHLSRRRTPPRLLNYVGGPEFDEIGKTYFAHIRRWADLKPDERVLDVGCGIGRVTMHLADYLSERGSYEGFDIVELGVRWCEQKITKQHPNFRFRHANIHNKEYNEKGDIDASSFVFPYPANEFDFVFATSVFTHMLPEAALHYLTEIRRVLRPGGRCMISFFFLDAESKKHTGTCQ